MESENKSLWQQMAIAGGLMVALVFAVYWPALRGGFVWDDLLTVQKNPLLTGEFSLVTVWLRTDFPLATVMLWLEWLLWGKSTLGYHIVNALLHATCVFLLWRALVRLKIPAAGLAAFLFAVHPLCVASVAWISELKNTLSLCFFLLAFLCCLRFEDESAESNSQPRKWYWLSLGAFFLALLSKTSAVVLPVLLLVCTWWRGQRLAKLDLLRVLPFFALAVLFGLRTVWFQAEVMPTQTGSLASRLGSTGLALWFYLYKALLPINLNTIYQWPTGSSLTIVSYGLLLLYAGILALGWRFRRTWGRHLLFGLVFFVVALAPVLGILDMSFFAITRVSDHLAYLAVIPVVTLVAVGLDMVRPPKAVQVVAAALVVMLSVLTFQRAKVFATDEGLWRDTLAKNPESWNAHNNLACILAEKGPLRLDEAMSEFEVSLKLNPRNTKAHCNLGNGLMIKNRPAEAEQHFLAALKIRPDDVDALRLYAQYLASTGKLPQAIEHLQTAVRVQPETQLRLMLAQLLTATGRRAEALAEYRKVIEAKPNNVDALNNLAGILAISADEKIRNGPEAVRLAERAVRLTENQQAAPLGTLAAAYAEAGRFSEAVSTAEKAVQVAQLAGDGRTAAIHQKLIQLYAAGRPYHEPTSGGPR